MFGLPRVIRMTERRAVSTSLDYVLSLSIAAILVTGLIIGGSQFVENRQENVIRTELTVLGHQLASQIHSVDRMAEASDSAGAQTVWLNRSYPSSVAGSTYIADIRTGTTDEINLSSAQPDVSVEIRITTDTELAPTSADGGPIRVRFDSSVSPPELVVENV
jgi:hypothetical protein